MAVLLGGISGTKELKYNFNELDKIMLDSLEKTAKKTSTEKIKLALSQLKATYKKYNKKASKRDNEYNKAQRYILIQELRLR